MKDWTGKRVCVIGLGASGRAAVEWLLERSALVTVIDEGPERRAGDVPSHWIEQEVTCHFGSGTILDGIFDLAVVSPGVPRSHPQVVSLLQRDVPVWSELELGWQATDCPVIAITGTNGKTTTTELVAALLKDNRMGTEAVGNIGTPLSSVTNVTRQLDAVTVEVSSFQLEMIHQFRPAVAVLLNLAPDHLDRHGTCEEYVRAKARIFENQERFDLAIIQWEAWKELQRLGVVIPAKVLTFSTQTAKADLTLDRTLLVSQLPGWGGAILDLDACNLTGSHNAENLMAALLVGRAMKLTVEEMLPALQQFRAGAHRCELVGESGDVRFFNDSKATNPHALRSALRSMPAGANRQNVWLIAGGQDKGLDFCSVGPEVARRVKGAFLLGEAAGAIESAWKGIAPCKLSPNLIEAVAEAGRNAVPEDVVLLSPACASFDMFDSYQHRGETFKEVVMHWIKANGGGE